VTATIDGVPGTLWLTVAPRTVAVVTVTGPTSTPKEGDTVQLTATARDEFGNVIPDATATWSSSDPNVAVVSTAGLVQTLATGTVAVTATVNGVSGTPVADDFGVAGRQYHRGSAHPLLDDLFGQLSQTICASCRMSG